MVLGNRPEAVRCSARGAPYRAPVHVRAGLRRALGQPPVGENRPVVNTEGGFAIVAATAVPR